MLVRLWPISNVYMPSNCRHVLTYWPLGAAVTLSHKGRVTHMCVSKLTIIGSDNSLLPGRHEAVIWTNAGLFEIWIWKITSWRSQSHHTGVSELEAILLKTLHNRHIKCKVTLSRSLPSTTKHGSHRPWKVLEFECYLENASFFNLPWKLAILLQNRLLSHNKYIYKYSKKIRKGTLGTGRVWRMTTSFAVVQPPVADRVSSYCRLLSQCWIIVNSKLRNKLQWNLKQNSYIFIKNMHLKMLSVKWQQFSLGLNVINQQFANSYQG